MGEVRRLGEERAAGAVLWRHGSDGYEVAVVHRPRYDDWSLPKGKARPREHPLVNAVREVAEETGLRPVLGRPLGRCCYQVAGRAKRVDYWAATPVSPPPAGRSAPGAETGDGDEVDRREWLPVGAALGRLSYHCETGILRQFAAAPGVTVPYVFLRHASAGRKRAGPAAEDVLRPLDTVGTSQATELAAVLSCFGPARAVSSATARCVQTLLPYALLANVAVTADPALTWVADEGETAAAAAASARLAVLLNDRTATIVCGHGETLPKLLAQACAHVGAPLPADPALDKAAFWVMHIATTAAVPVALERHSVG